MASKRPYDGGRGGYDGGGGGHGGGGDSLKRPRRTAAADPEVGVLCFVLLCCRWVIMLEVTWNLVPGTFFAARRGAVSG